MCQKTKVFVLAKTSGFPDADAAAADSAAAAAEDPDADADANAPGPSNVAPNAEDEDAETFEDAVSLFERDMSQ